MTQHTGAFGDCLMPDVVTGVSLTVEPEPKGTASRASNGKRSAVGS